MNDAHGPLPMRQRRWRSPSSFLLRHRCGGYWGSRMRLGSTDRAGPSPTSRSARRTPVRRRRIELGRWELLSSLHDRWDGIAVFFFLRRDRSSLAARFGRFTAAVEQVHMWTNLRHDHRQRTNPVGEGLWERSRPRYPTVGERVAETGAPRRLLRRLQTGSVRAYAPSWLAVWCCPGYYLWRRNHGDDRRPGKPQCQSRCDARRDETYS